MSILFVDSFGHYATADLGLKWSAATHGDTGAEYGIGFAEIGAPAESMGTSLALGGVGNTVRKNLAGKRTLIVGTGIYLSAAPEGAASFWLQLLGSDAPQLVLTVSPDGALQAWRASTVGGAADILVGSSSAGALVPGAYAFVEVKATSSAASAGAIEVRVNGVPVLSVQGARTNATGSSVEQISGVLLGNGAGAAGTTYYCNLYICDTLGGINNDYLGQVVIESLQPQADGHYREFTPRFAGAHYQQLNGLTTGGYVSSSAVGARDTYGFGTMGGSLLESGAALYGVQITDVSLIDTAGARAIAHMARHGISEQVSASFTLGTAKGYHSTIQETDPATGAAWTLAGLNATEFGFVVYA